MLRPIPEKPPQVPLSPVPPERTRYALAVWWSVSAPLTPVADARC